MTEERVYTAVDSLIERLASAAHIDHMALWERAKEERKAKIGRMFDEGITLGVAMGVHPILNQTEDSLRTELQSIKQSLDSQIAVFNHGLDEYFRTGEYPPPYYPI